MTVHKKIWFVSDLDNTLIRSHKQKRAGDVCIEIYQEREQSFMPKQALDLLPKVCQSMEFVPVTSRSLAQYNRIAFLKEDANRPKLALVCNGGILLQDGKIHEGWMQQSQILFEKAEKELISAMQLLKRELACELVKLVDNLVVFAKAEDPAACCQYLLDKLDKEKVIVQNVNKKVYVLPKGLDKASSVERLRSMPGTMDGVERLCAAGDSVMDFGMLDMADLAIAPHGYDVQGMPAAKVAMPESPQEDFCFFVVNSAYQFLRTE